MNLLNRLITFFISCFVAMGEAIKQSNVTAFVKLLLKLLAAIGATIGTVVGTVYILVKSISAAGFAFANFVTSHADGLMIAGFVVGGCVWLYVWAKSKKPQTVAPQQSQLPTVNHQKVFNMLRKCLFDALGNVADVIGLVTPSQPTELNPPGNVFHFTRGTVEVYQYFCLKKPGDSINTWNIITLLEGRFEQMQNANELPATSNNCFIHNGQPFCTVLVMDVKESGGFIEIDLAFATTAACEQVLQHRRSRNDTDRGGLYDDEV